MKKVALGCEIGRPTKSNKDVNNFSFSFQKAGLVWSSLGDERGDGHEEGTDGGGAGGRVGGDLAPAMAGVNQWMAVMAEHMAQVRLSIYI